MIILHRWQNLVYFFTQEGEKEETGAGNDKKVFNRPVDIFIQVCKLQQCHCYLADQRTGKIGVNPKSWNKKDEKIDFNKETDSSNQEGKLCLAKSVDNTG